MRFSNILYALPLTLAAAAIVSRDANAVYNDITGIDTAVRKLTAALNSYNGGITQAEPVVDASIRFSDFVDAGPKDALLSTLIHFAGEPERLC